MNGPQTRKYELYFEQEKERLKQELKKKLIGATYETDQEVLAEFNFYVNRIFHQLFAAEDENQNRVSWFKESLFEKFKHDKYRYKDGFQVDGFIENILPDIQQQFQRRYESADERTRTERYFDHTLVLHPDPDPEEIIKMLALHDAYTDFFDRKQELLNEAIETLEKEKFLVEENLFNGLAPIKLFEFIEQLLQNDSTKNKPFLTKDQAIDLTNMICKNLPVSEPVVMQIDPSQKRQIEVFFINFYKYCKDTVDTKGNKEKYMAILNRYIAQFQGKTIYPSNFIVKEKDLPLLINIHPKYLRWMNVCEISRQKRTLH